MNQFFEIFDQIFEGFTGEKDAYSKLFKKEEEKIDEVTED